MRTVKEYTVNINGIDHTMQLSDEDAKRLNAEAVSTKSADAPANKSRTAAKKG